MKQKLIIAAILLLTTAIGLAQKSKPKTTFGIKAGLNFTNVTIKDADGEKVKGNKFKTGINVGFYADVALGQKGYFHPGLIFTSKGTVNKVITAGETINKTTISAGYIEVPLNIIYKSNGQEGGFIIGGGPYVAYGVSGIVKERSGGYKETSLKFKTKTSVNFNFNSNVYYLSPFDGGLGFLIGFEGKSGVSFLLNGQLGLINQALQVSGVNFEISKYRNYGVGFSVGYRF